MTAKPTSVDSERSFSEGGGFTSKVLSRLGDKALFFLFFSFENVFQKQTHKKILEIIKTTCNCILFTHKRIALYSSTNNCMSEEEMG